MTKLSPFALAVLVGAATSLPARAETAPIAVAAHRFAFAPDEIHVKAGETARLVVKSDDVTHGFFQRALGIDADLEPGKSVPVEFTPREKGKYVLICDHFCGAQHGNMKMTIVVE